MSFPALRRFSHHAIWLATLAILFAAVSPALNATRATLLGQKIGPTLLFAELCTRLGMVKVPLGEVPAPSAPQHAGVDCSLCLPGGTWLGWPPADNPVLAFSAATHEVPLFFARTHHSPANATAAWPRAPPVYS